MGSIGVLHREPETRLEMVVPGECISAVHQALQDAHPYEEGLDRVALKWKGRFGRRNGGGTARTHGRKHLSTM